MEESVYIDGIKQIDFINGTVRLSFYTTKPGLDGKNIDKIAAELVLSPQGFTQVAEIIKKFYDKMAEKGIYQKQ